MNKETRINERNYLAAPIFPLLILTFLGFILTLFFQEFFVLALIMGIILVILSGTYWGLKKDKIIVYFLVMFSIIILGIINSAVIVLCIFNVLHIGGAGLLILIIPLFGIFLLNSLKNYFFELKEYSNYLLKKKNVFAEELLDDEMFDNIESDFDNSLNI